MGAPGAIVGLKNYSDAPLVTVNLALHDGDAHYLPRAIDSLTRQNMDLKQIQVLLALDGPPE